MLPSLLSYRSNTDGSKGVCGARLALRQHKLGGHEVQLGLQRIKPFINSIVIKDFKWGIVKGKWKPIHVPLGEGMVDFNRYFSLLKKYKINVPISLHVEYDLGGAEKGKKKITIPKKEVFTNMKKDLTFLRDAWRNAE